MLPSSYLNSFNFTISRSIDSLKNNHKINEPMLLKTERKNTNTPGPLFAGDCYWMDKLYDSNKKIRESNSINKK
jgi:hypothetical protein